MKTRQGFVSNSSAASFVIHWRIKGYGEKIDKHEALKRLFEIYTEGEDSSKEIDWDNEWDKSLKDRFEQIEGSTVDNKDNSFTTEFGTSMMNSAEDFGEAAKSMALALIAGSRFKIVDTKIESDGM